MPDLNDMNISQYLQANELIQNDTFPEIEALGGGVSNIVLRATTPRTCLILKQPLSNLDVDFDWPADVRRVHNEAAAARAYAIVVEQLERADIRVPAVHFEDTERNVIAIECAPETANSWKRELLDGTVDSSVARRMGAFLGQSQMILKDDPSVRSSLDEDGLFDQLRLDPYHRTVAQRHPDIAERIIAEIERIGTVNRTLVHGDFSPKNVLVDRHSGEIWILDFEVAHWGDPAFDAAFFLNHLFIKSLHNDSLQREYLRAAMAFWESYDDIVEWTVEADVVRELAILMLARVDGKSPVEYVTDEQTKNALRTVSKRAIRREVPGLDEFGKLIREVNAS